MNKTKRVHARISEEEELFIKDNDLSKSAIFRLGLEILELAVAHHSATVTVKMDNGETKTFVLVDDCDVWKK